MAPGGRGRMGVWPVERSDGECYSRAATIAVGERAPEFVRAERGSYRCRERGGRMRAEPWFWVGRIVA